MIDQIFKWTKILKLERKINSVVISSPTPTIIFNDVNLIGETNLRIKLNVKPTLGSSTEMYMYLNGDLTQSNYVRETIVANGASLTAGQTSTANIISSYTPTTNPILIPVEINISQLTGAYPTSLVRALVHSGTNPVMINAGVYRKNVDPVTTIRLEMASNFSVGTVATLYRI